MGTGKNIGGCLTKSHILSHRVREGYHKLCHVIASHALQDSCDRGLVKLEKATFSMKMYLTSIYIHKQRL